VPQRPQHADDRHGDQREREDHRDETEDGSDDELDGEDRDRCDEDPRDHALAEVSER
jgi:hypothetical protein